MADSLKILARRLIQTREAIGFNQSDFCQEIRVAKNVYNPFEKGSRRITLDVALKIRVRFGVSLDWIYCGDAAHLPVEIYRKLSAAA